MAEPVTHRRVLAVALPIVLSNVTIPLLGLVDTGVIGQLGQAAPIGAVGIGAIVLTSVYWIFGFLRMGTSGLVAQSHGAGDAVDSGAHLLRALGIGLAAGLALVQALADRRWPVDAALKWPNDVLVPLRPDATAQVPVLDAAGRRWGKLAGILAQVAGDGAIVVGTGVNVDQCVTTTMEDAYFRDYNPVLLTDATATSSPAYCKDAVVFNARQCWGFTMTTEAFANPERVR